jgi:hypothetical protein
VHVPGQPSGGIEAVVPPVALAPAIEAAKLIAAAEIILVKNHLPQKLILWNLQVLS